MKKFWNFIKRNWIVLAVSTLLVVLGIIAVVHICKQERKINTLREDYNELVRDYNSLVVRDSILYEDYLALQRIDSICAVANDSLARATSELRHRCDSLQKAKKIIIRTTPAKKRTIPVSTRSREYPDLDW